MSFGRNPHVAKAEAAEQKALNAKDGLARTQAWREAAHYWQRASDRETDAKRKQQYVDKADVARATADESPADSDLPEATAASPGGERRAKPSLLN